MIGVRCIEKLAIACMYKDRDLWEELGIICATSSDPTRSTAETKRHVYEPRIKAWLTDNGYMELEPLEIKKLTDYLTAESFHVLCEIIEEMYNGKKEKERRA